MFSLFPFPEFQKPLSDVSSGYLLAYLFVFGCTESSLLHGDFLYCAAGATLIKCAYSLR